MPYSAGSTAATSTSAATASAIAVATASRLRVGTSRIAGCGVVEAGIMAR